MGWLKRLFGESILNFEIEGIDRNTGEEVSGDVTLEYEGRIETMDLEKSQKEVTLRCWQEGINVTKIKYLGATGT